MTNLQKFTSTVLLFFLLLLFIGTNTISNGNFLAKRYFIIVLGSVLILVFSINLIFRKKALNIRITIIDLALFLLLFYIGIRLLFMPFAKGSIPYYIILIALTVFLVVLKKMFLQVPKLLLLLILVFLCIGTFESVYGLLQQAKLLDNTGFNFFKVVGSFGNSTPYSIYLVSILIFSFGFFLYSKNSNDVSKTIYRYFALTTALLIAAALAFTGCRTSWVAAIIGVIIVSWPLIRLNKTFKYLLGSSKNKFLSLAFLSIIAISTAVFLYGYKPQSAKGRLLVYEISLAMIKDKPMFGHGFCRFISEYNNYQAMYFKIHPNSNYILLADNIYYGFNEFIQAAVELGLVGFFLLVWLIVLILQSKTKSEWQYIALPAKGALIGILICCLFSYPFHILPVVVNIVFFLAIIMAAGSDTGFVFSINKNIFKPVLFLSTFAVLFVCYNQWKDFEARKQWKQAGDFAQIYNFKKALPLYENAYKELHYDGDFLYDYGSDLMITNPLQATKILEEAKKFEIHTDLQMKLGNGYQALKQFKKAENAYYLASLMVPSRFRPKYALFDLYRQNKQYTKATEIAKIILGMKVKIPSTTVTLIKLDVKNWLLERPRSPKS